MSMPASLHKGTAPVRHRPPNSPLGWHWPACVGNAAGCPRTPAMLSSASRSAASAAANAIWRSRSLRDDFSFISAVLAAATPSTIKAISREAPDWRCEGGHVRGIFSGRRIAQLDGALIQLAQAARLFEFTDRDAGIEAIAIAGAEQCVVGIRSIAAAVLLAPDQQGNADGADLAPLQGRHLRRIAILRDDAVAGIGYAIQDLECFDAARQRNTIPATLAGGEFAAQFGFAAAVGGNIENAPAALSFRTVDGRDDIRSSRRRDCDAGAIDDAAIRLVVRPGAKIAYCQHVAAMVGDI